MNDEDTVIQLIQHTVKKIEFSFEYKVHFKLGVQVEAFATSNSFAFMSLLSFELLASQSAIVVCTTMYGDAESDNQHRNVDLKLQQD